MKRRAAAVAATGALLLALAACDSHESGPPGKIVAKDSDQSCHSSGSGKRRHRSCSTDYELTVRTKDGDRVEFDASRSDYDDCYRGSAYPKCTKR